MPYGICTLHLFGISCFSSETKGSGYHPVTQDFDSDEDINDYDSWNTTYYNSNGICGTSTSEGFNYSSGIFCKWKTIYYDSNGCNCGNSITEGHNYSAGSYCRWDTKYYDLHGNFCGSSSSGGMDNYIDGYCGWNTKYYTSNGVNAGSSKSKEGTYSCSYSVWETDYYHCDSLNDSCQLIHSSDQNISHPHNDIIKFINQAKQYYISKAWCINSSDSIFSFSDKNRFNLPTARNRVIAELRKRAKKNKGGASELTLKHFGIEL